MSPIMIFLLPSVFGLKIFMNQNKDKKIFDLIIYYLLLVLFSNFFGMLILMLFGKGQEDLIGLFSINYIFSIKYMAITMILNLILSFLFTIIIKYFTFTIEVENERKKDIKKKSKNN